MKSVRLIPRIAEFFDTGSKDGTVETIGAIFKKFQYRDIDFTTNGNFAITTRLAPCYGTLEGDSESYKQMDERLKIMIAAAHKSLAALPKGQRTFDDVVQAFMKNTLLEPMKGSNNPVCNNSQLTKTDSNFFKMGRQKDKSVVLQVLSWFQGLISDDDVMQSTQINIDTFAEVVATTGAAIEHLEDIISKKEHLEINVMDVGVLRYPDITEPYFKLYRIELKAWRDTTRFMVFGKDSNGITGTFKKRTFKPRDSVIEMMNPDSTEMAIADADAMFAPNVGRPLTEHEIHLKAVREAEAMFS